LVALVILAGGIGVAWVSFRTPSTVEGEFPLPNLSESLADDQFSTDRHEPLTRLTTDAVRAIQAADLAQLDPGQDGWDSEVIAERAKAQLTRLAARLTGQELDDILPKEVLEDVSGSPLRPEKLIEVFHEGVDSKSLIVRRAPSNKVPPTTFRGRVGLARALDELGQPYINAGDVHVKIKVVRVEMAADSAETTALFEADGPTTAGFLQQRATWVCQWRRSPQEALELAEILTKDYEEVQQRGPWLVDCTEAVLQESGSSREQFAYGLNHWLSRLGNEYGMHAFAQSGLAVGDVNGDGLDDVYVCQPGGLPNRLLIQQADGSVQDQSREAGVDWLDQTSSALIIDLDNDGDQDLVAATDSGLLVMENYQAGRFRWKATLATQSTDTKSLSAVDFDEDGDLDFYVCLDFDTQSLLSGAAQVEFVYHNANDGGGNLLFRNDIDSSGKWFFSDVTEEVGLDADNRRHSLACVWEDYDNDGDQDLYVANDYGQNCLYQYDRGQFKNVAPEANAVDSASGMSASWADYNRDGWMDLYVANMFSSAGRLITRQAQFKAYADERLRMIYARFAKGNTLLENNGQGQFHEVGGSLGVEMGRWAWSSVFADINNDAWEDLVVANGYITTEDTGDL